ncbi:MAG: AEC family transporter [Candidatus Hadarchaeum sp.]|uniref:AEC family transporter n=1 Tax=Candidatus Hadarchaeum sp. TaxID=2883567 RepID=UPI003D0EACA6
MSDLTNIVLMPSLMLLGILLGRVRFGLKAKHLEFLLINIMAPILMFAEIFKADLSGITLENILLLSVIYVGLCFGVSYLSSRRSDKRELGTVVINSTFFNNIFLPFPLIYAFYGDLSAALLFSLPTMILHNTVGVFLASYWGHGRFEKKVLVRSATYPPLLGFLLGLLLQPVVGWFAETAAFFWLHQFGLLTVYLSLIWVGMVIPLSKESFLIFGNRTTGLITVNRLVISPIIAVILAAIFNPAEAVRNTLLIMALMPPAVTNLLIISRFNLDVRATSQSLFVPTLLSMAAVFALRGLAVL